MPLMRSLVDLHYIKKNLCGGVYCYQQSGPNQIKAGEWDEEREMKSRIRVRNRRKGLMYRCAVWAEWKKREVEEWINTMRGTWKASWLPDAFMHTVRARAVRRELGYFWHTSLSLSLVWDYDSFSVDSWKAHQRFQMILHASHTTQLNLTTECDRGILDALMQ